MAANILSSRARTYIYQVKYMDRIPKQPSLTHTATSSSLAGSVEFMKIMMCMNRSVVNNVRQRFQVACGCSSNYECFCSCWQDNPHVYDLFGDVMRPLPSMFQLRSYLEEDLTGYFYRIGHDPRLDEELPMWPRFEFKVERLE